MEVQPVGTARWGDYGYLYGLNPTTGTWMPLYGNTDAGDDNVSAEPYAFHPTVYSPGPIGGQGQNYSTFIDRVAEVGIPALALAGFGIGVAGLLGGGAAVAAEEAVGDEGLLDLEIGSSEVLGDAEPLAEVPMDDYMDISEGGDFVGDLPVDDGSDVYNVMQAGVSPGVVSGAVSFGRALLQRFGVGAGTAAAAGVAGAARVAGKIVLNGVTMSARQLWPAIKKYGPTAVATTFGVSVASLMELAFTVDPTMGGGSRRRRRGISSRDIRTTKRVVGFVNRISHQIGCVRRPHFRKR